MYKLVYTQEAKSKIDKLDVGVKRQLKAAIEIVAQNPDSGKKLTHELSGFWSYRSGDYRVIYQTLHKEVLVLVVTMSDRKKVYEELIRKLS